jgi:hypothetical protein
MPDKNEPAETEPEKADEPRRHGLGEKVHDHLMAAEVAMEEAAGYGETTALVKGAEAAVDPESELGSSEDDEPSR